jgi:hypothetical protein
MNLVPRLNLDVAAILETLVTLGRAHKREGDVFTL